MNAMTEMKDTRASRDALVAVLGSSLYPGAKRNSIEMVIDYCEALHLDPLQKPVHIVPMLVKNGQLDKWGNDQKEWRDVIMPGIGLYRIQAARTGAYLGVSEPVFGPDIEMEYQEEFWTENPDKPGKNIKKTRPVTVTFPLWCKVTVRRQVAGVIAEFTALEYWKENCAHKGDGPNTMWAKRPYGQLAKCAEAQALRKGFPEVGTEPTMEEMEGKLVDINDMQTVEGNPPEDAAPSLTPQRKSAAAAATDAEPAAPATGVKDATTGVKDGNVIDGDFKEVPAAAEQKPAAAPAAPVAGAGGPVLTEGMLAIIGKKMDGTGKTAAQFLAHFGVELTSAPKASANDYIQWASQA